MLNVELKTSDWVCITRVWKRRGSYLLFFENVNQLELLLETHNEFRFLSL